MAGKYYTYRNVNGKVTEDSGTFENDVGFGDIVDSMFNSTFNFFDSPLFIDYTKKSPARFLKSESSSAFPPHSKWISEDKVLHYEIGLCGISEKDIKVDVDDNKIIIQIKKDVEDEKRVYSYKGLRLPTDETLELKFDPKFYDVNTTEISLNNGLLSIAMQPRAELKPIKKSLFGQLKIAAIEENKAEDNEEKSETEKKSE